MVFSLLMLPSRENLNRRDWITSVLQVLGAAASSSLVAGTALAQDHSHASSRSALADPAWQPAFLDARQNALLIDLGECIIPGSKAALCNRVIDLILTLESEQNRQLTTGALAAFDVEAKSRFGRPFAEVTAGQKNELLSAGAGDSGKLSREFHVIKEWLADAYWSSRDGLHELGWTGRIAWAEFPGCEHRGAR